MKNKEAIHQFINGLNGDFENHAESSKSYNEALNGRLFSHNGILSFSSLKGTLEVYNNPEIVRYLGYWAFTDELIIFVKCMPTSGGINDDYTPIETESVDFLISNSFQVEIPFNVLSTNIEDDINLNTYINTIEVPINILPTDDPFNFDSEYSCTLNEGGSIDLSEYYIEKTNENYEICSINSSGNYENNKEYIDCIFSLRKDDNGNIYDELKWSGLLNWDINSKIVSYGIHENDFYKRVYFTDYINPFRVVNLKDKKLSSRTNLEFDSFRSSALLQPRIELIDSLGQIKASTVLYAYRLITDNGQSTEFSPFSVAAKIVLDDDDINFSGGDVSESTNKRVVIKCNVIGHENFNEIEAVAVEYEADGSPTAIRSLGIYKVGLVNLFNHYGNESEFDGQEITLTKLLQRKNTWKYCSDLSSKTNILLASGLRNDPLPSELLNIDKNFILHGWDENGETHDCLINPDPSRYRFIDPLHTDSYFYIKQKMYNSIQVFGNFTIDLLNNNTGFVISKSFISSNQNYQDFTLLIYDWLLLEQQNISFQVNFPNLLVTNEDGRILFSPIDDSIETDINDYSFNYNTTQVIEDLKEDIEFLNLSVSSNLVYGGVSLGFNDGNGIRITYKTEFEEVLNKSTSNFSGGSPILDIKKPSLLKGFFKGEIYRIGFQVYDKKGLQLFTIPLGDLKIPEIGEVKKYIDSNGFPVFSIETYRNSYEFNGKLYAERIIMNVEVRLSCFLQKYISMYQLVYVERTENNRTILAQGISAPLERCNRFTHSQHVNLKDPVSNKWNLPYYGGPSYDSWGLNKFDQDPYQEEQSDAINRITTHRALFYFDSPDFIYNKISTDKVENSFVSRIGRLNTDHTRTAIRSSSGEVYPKFSRKIYRNEMDGETNGLPFYLNLSVFSKESVGIKNLIPIEKASEINQGEILSGAALDVPQDISNNALTLGRQAWFYSSYARKSEACSLDNGAKSELFNSSNFSEGYPSLIIKSTENIFTNDFINQNVIHVGSETREYTVSGTFDTHALVNLHLKNESYIYGGRTELAFSKNTYIPLSETIPVIDGNNNTQCFTCYGDTYTTLFIRLKNDFGPSFVGGRRDMNNSGGCESKYEEHEYSRFGAWMYAFVVETQVEPRLSHSDYFYRELAPFNFIKERSEIMNEAYFQENTLRTYIPKPFRFKDDPNMNNIISTSKVKLNGDFIDNWTEFLVNDFYELEKDKGTVFNLAKQEGNIYAIQERQTSLLRINQQTFVPTEDGSSLSVQQSDGAPISNHDIISNYGTSIRRAIVENDFGFNFIDEKRFEFIKVKKPLLISNSLSLKFRAIFDDDDIIDTEGYYDDEYKESNIRIRTKQGLSFTISYNEALKVFNGWIEYDNDIYMNWNNFVFSPKTINVIKESDGNTRLDSSSLHQLNKGMFLNFFGIQKMMKLGVICNINPMNVKVFKHWCGIMNIDYNINQIDIETNLNHSRIILGSHHRYKIREGRHSVPLKNRTDWDDLRGEWMKITVTIESLNNAKIDIFSFINFVRNSYQ